MDIPLNYQFLGHSSDSKRSSSRANATTGEFLASFGHRASPHWVRPMDRFIPLRRHSVDPAELYSRLRPTYEEDSKTVGTDRSSTSTVASSEADVNYNNVPSNDDVFTLTGASTPHSGAARGTGISSPGTMVASGNSAASLLLARRSAAVGRRGGRNRLARLSITDIPRPASPRVHLGGGSSTGSAAATPSTPDLDGQTSPRVLNFFAPRDRRLSSSTGGGSWVFSPTEELSFLARPRTPTDRKLPVYPETSHQLPGIRNDVASNLLSWSKRGVLAVAVNDSLLLWRPRSSKAPSVIRPPWRRGARRQAVQDTELECDITSVAWNPSGSTLAFGTEHGNIWLMKDTEGNAQFKRVLSHSVSSRGTAGAQVTSLTWTSSSPAKLFLGRFDGRIECCDPKASTRETIWSAGDAIYHMALSPDGRHLAASHAKNKVVVIAVAKMIVLQEFKAHKFLTKALAWCPWQPHLLATGGGSDEDGYIRIWNAASAMLVHEADTEAMVLEVTWAEATREIVTSHGGRHARLLLWPASLSRGPLRLADNSASGVHLAISPDNARLASLTIDGMLKVWHCFETATGRDRLSPLPTSPLAMCIR